MEKPKENFNNVEYLTAEQNNLADIAKCHKEVFQGQFMTEMGPVWLKDMYGFFQNYHAGFVIIAQEKSGQVIGFVAGGDSQTRQLFLSRAKRRHILLLFQKFITSNIVRKKLLAELFRQLKIRNNRKKEHRKVIRKSGNLLSIGVLPEYQGSEIANKLMEQFIDASQKNGAEILKLSVRLENDRAINFYKKHGWYEIHRNNTSIRFERPADINNIKDK